MNVIDGLKEVYFGILLQKLDSVVVTFVLFAFAWPLFIVLHVSRSTRRTKVAARRGREWRLLFGLNLSSSVLWVGFMVAMKWLEPSIVSALVGGFGIVATVLVNRVARPNSVMLQADYFSAGGIALASAFLCWVAAAGYAASVPVQPWAVAVGVLASVACGMGMAVTTVFSKMLFEQGMSSLHIYAHRFYLLVAITGSYALANPMALHAVLEHVSALAGLALLGVVLPLLLLQQGIKRCEPVTTEAILAASPLFTLLFQQFDQRLEFSLFSLLGISCICLAAAYNGYSHLQHTQVKKVSP